MRRAILVFFAVAIGIVCGQALARRQRAQVAGAVSTFGGDPQHTNVFEPTAQDLNAIHWSTTIDVNPGAFAHYGAPLITEANTVLVPVKIAGDGFRIDAFDGTDGSSKYSLATDYVLPPHVWIPAYQPGLAEPPAGLRLYYPGAGGTIYYIADPDAGSPGVPVHQVFYTTLANYQANAAAFNSTVFINTPITADSNGNVFFGFRVSGTAPAPLNTTQSGFARIDPNGNAVYVLAGAAAADGAIARDSHNCAPALSNDESTLYVVAKSASTENYGYLIGLDSTTLATKYKVFLKDPRNGSANNAGIPDNGTASPTVAPDGDVYFGVFANPNNGSRGFLLRFSGDLAVAKTPGAFGWDYTAAIVPKEMVPSYAGASPYLIFSKYNNYPFGGGDGVNRIALLDPNATEVEPHASSNGLLVMREVLTVTGPTPDAERETLPDAVREWCINTAAVNPATQSIFTPSEDGHIYRWNLATNSLSQGVRLTQGIGEPYVPTVIGPDGIVYTLNGGTLFALGGLEGVGVTLSSSNPDVRSVVVGQPLTFTATVANTGAPGATPTGTVSFQDTVYFVIGHDQLGSSTTPLATVPLDGAGQAAYTTSTLGAANHFITATYSGDGAFDAGQVTLVQKIHASGTTTALSGTPNPSNATQSVTFTATVASSPPGSGTPTGMVTFQEGAQVLAQLALTNGTASFSTSALGPGSHTVTAVYASDTKFAASSGNAEQVVQSPTNTRTLTPTNTGTATPTRTPTVFTSTQTSTPTRTPTSAPPTQGVGPIGFANDCDYSNSSPPAGGLFRDVIGSGNVNRGTDNFGTGHASLNFNTGASSGTNGLTLFDTDPTTATPTLWSGSVSVSADTIQSGTNANKPGLVTLFNGGAGNLGLALVLSEAGSTDTIELHKVPQTGNLTASSAGTLLASTNVGGVIADGVWYRVTADVSISGDSLSVTGRFFTHAVATNPDSSVNVTPAGTLTYTNSLTALGLQGSGEAGMIFDVGASTSKAGFTNFRIAGALAPSGTDPLPGRLTVIKHVINDSGGTAAASNFTMSGAGCSLPGAEAPGTTLTLEPGSYSVTETGPAGYTATSSADCSGTLASGDAKTCTITNDDNGPAGTPTSTPSVTPTSAASTATPTRTPTPTPGGPASISDNFDRPNSTVLGNGWVELAGDLNIVSSHLENAAVAGDHMATQPGLTAATETVDVDFTSSGNNAAPSFGVVLRCQDCGTAGVAPRNYYRIYRTTGGSSLLKISKVVGGVETVLKSVSISNPAAGVKFHLRGSANGTTLSVSVGTVQTSVTETTGTFTSGTTGLFIRSGGGSTAVHQADNFQATVQ